MKLGIKIAFRFLKSSFGQTLLIIIGIAVGVSVQIFIGSLIQGLQKSLIESTIGSSPHITITSTETKKEFSGYETLASEILSSDERIRVVSYVLDEAAFLLTSDSSQSLLIRGLPLERSDEIYHFNDALTEGRLPSAANEIIVGTVLQEKYSLSLNDVLTIQSTSNETLDCIIVGFFDLKVASLNESWGIMTLSGAQEFFQFPDQVTGIEMQLTSDFVFDADIVADQIALLIDSDKSVNSDSASSTIKVFNSDAGISLLIENWKVQNESLLSGLQGQSISSIMIQVFVMISVVLGIASVLAITVLQKSKQIGILKAMGMKNKDASYIFLTEGAILGFGGALLGILLGLSLALMFTKFAVTADGSPVVALYINPWFILLSGCIAVLASLVASLIPAIRSSKLNPIDIIRNS